MSQKVSIITVVYNGANFIEQTIKSVISQDYNNLEYIIIDGGSTDGTQDIIKKYDDKIAFWVSEKDSGIYNAMNKGWRKASGDFIGILNADDYYLEGTITQVVNAFTNSGADIVYGGMTKLRNIAGNRAENKTKTEWDVCYHKHLAAKQISPQTYHLTKLPPKICAF